MDASKEFLTPGSMVTPGFAGGMTMAITNVLCSQFGILAPGPAYLGLALSFLFGLLVWASTETPRLLRVIYYVLNSLVIFVVAVGSNTVGGATAGPARQLVSLATSESRPGGFLISSAIAQVTSPGWCCLGDQVVSVPRDTCNAKKGTFYATEESAKRSCAAATKEATRREREKNEGFFRPWVRAGGA